MKTTGLTRGAKYSLFIVSYAPLFFIMSFNQFYKYREFLSWGGINKKSLLCFGKYFGAISVLIALLFIGSFGLFILLRNIHRRTELNGDIVNIIDIENKNSESITYLFTYIIPFVFQDLSQLTNVVPVFVLLAVTFRIYTNSSMILINPTISLKYSLYMTEYKYPGSEVIRKGMLLTKNKFLEEDDSVKIKKIGHKLFYAVNKGEQNAK